jgi:hypothetical protein
MKWTNNSLYSPKTDFAEMISVKQAGELILGAVTHLVRGILQLATAPLNLLVRMPLRWLLTPKKKRFL